MCVSRNSPVSSPILSVHSPVHDISSHLPTKNHHHHQQPETASPFFNPTLQVAYLTSIPTQPFTKMSPSSSNKTQNNTPNMSQQNQDKPLRQIAAEKLHGPNANPTQLGDPISLKAETTASKYPAPGRENNEPGAPSKTSTHADGGRGGGDGGSHEEKMLRGEGPNGHFVRGMMTEEIRQGRVGRPSKTLEGDATSLKAETVGRDPVDHDNGVPVLSGGKGATGKSGMGGPNSKL